MLLDNEPAPLPKDGVQLLGGGLLVCLGWCGGVVLLVF